MIHRIKTWPEYFQEIKSGNKTFELRKNDRNYKIGDILLLQEYKLIGLNKATQKIEGVYTGEQLKAQVTYILIHEILHNSFGLEKGHCIMSIKLI